MQEKELLRAISDMMDEKFENFGRIYDEKLDARFAAYDEKLDARFAAYDEKLDVRLKPIEERLDRLEASGLELKEDVHNIHLCLENEIMPRLNTIEACYTSTYERYKAYVDRMEPLFSDVDNLKKTVSEHSRILKTLTAVPSAQAAAYA